MLELTIIGNLTADATIKDWNGKSLISFSVAENQSYTGADGVKHEKTTYVSCLKPVRGENSNIAQYLKKGTQVYVRGRASTKTFVRNDGSTDASLNCSVDFVQLLAGARKENTAEKQPAATPVAPQPVAPTTTVAQHPVGGPVAMPNDGNDDLPFM